MVPGFEQRPVGLARPELAHDGWRVLKILDGLEERNGLKAGVIAAGLDPHSTETREPEDVEHIFSARCSADDVLADGFRGVSLLQFRDGAERVEHLGGLLAQSWR